MGAEENKALIRRFVDELEREHFALYDELVAEDPIINSAPLGRDVLRRASMRLRAAFPDRWVRIEELDIQQQLGLIAVPAQTTAAETPPA